MEDGIYKIRFTTKESSKEKFGEQFGSNEHVLVVHFKNGKKDGGAMFFHSNGCGHSMPDAFKDDKFVPPSPVMVGYESFWGERESECEPELIISDEKLEGFVDFIKSGNLGGNFFHVNKLMPLMFEELV